MKNECNIVQDLMPLVIDGVASEESTQMVAEHVKDCEPCAKVYEELKSDLPQSARPMNYEEAAKALRKWRRMRTVLLSVLVAVLTLGGAVVGRGVWIEMRHIPRNYLAIDEYDAHMVRMQDGKVFMVFVTEKEGVDMFCSGGGSRGQWAYNIRSTRIPIRTQKAAYIYIGTWRDGAIWETYSVFEPETIKSLSVKDMKNERIVYTEGDDIPMASPEFETFIALESSINSLTDEHRAAYDAQYALVPEFQPE